jgi:hypothetical protein
MRKHRDPVQQALHHIQAEVDYVLDHSEGMATQRALAAALVEMGVGLGAERPTRPPMSLADLAQRPEPAVEEASPQPQDEQSAAADLLARTGAH